MKQGTDNNGFFAKLANWFNGIGYGAKAGIISGAALVVCCLIAGIWYFSSVAGGQNDPIVIDTPSSEISSEIISSEEESSEPISSEESSEPISSEEVSSEEESSEEVSSAPVSSAPVSSAPVSSAPVSSAPTSTDTTDFPGFSLEITSPTSAPETGEIQPAFTDIRKTNKDVVGQIYLAGTKLNYWVTQTTNNTYYLNHNINKASNGYGTPFVDFRAKITPSYQSTNITIYGHSDDANDTYLSAIKKYKDLAFYQAHPTITFNTIYGNGTYKVIGLFLENVDQSNSFGYHNFVEANDSFNTGKGLAQYVQQVKGRSFLSIPVDVQDGDKLITLSTCLSTSSKHSRYVLVARKVRPGESASVDVSAAKVNTNMIPASGPLN